MFSRRVGKSLILILAVVAFCGLIYASVGQCQNWAALPPYNTLWPLWSPALSPINAVTGLPTPVVSNLARTTVLPVQPGLTWDPASAYPRLLYNSPFGLSYYDPLLGVGLWPPAGYINPSTGAPIQLTLPAGYSALAPTDPAWIQTNVPLANQFYSTIAPFFGLIPTTLTTGFPLPTGVTFLLPPALPTTATLPPLPTSITSLLAPPPVFLTPTAII
jgi:hypothetical protein